MQELENSDKEDGSESRSGRRRVRVKKRIRVKKKSDPKSRARKILRFALWAIIVVIFLFALITMVKEADIRDRDKSFDFTPYPFSPSNNKTY